MADQAQERIQKAVETEIDRLDRNVQRPMQHKAYTCMAKCTANSKDSADQVCMMM